MYEKRIKRKIKEENLYCMEISEKLSKSGRGKGGHTGRDPGHIYTKKEKGITYAELSVGPDASGGGPVRGFPGAASGSDRGGSGFGQGGSDSVYHHDRCSVPVGGTDGDRPEERHYPGRGQAAAALYGLYVPGASEGA